MANKSDLSSRRGFLKTTAAAAAGTALLARGVYAAGGDTIKVGVVGCGGRGTGAADNVLHAAKGVQIVALGDVFRHRVEGCRRRLQGLAKDEEVKALGNVVDVPDNRCHVGLDAYERVINDPAVNYVILATPPGFRPLHIVATIAAGKNLFTEKPVGTDGAGIRQVLAAYDESLKKKLHIGAGTQRRHQTPYVETIKRIHDGAIGDIVLARAYWNGGGIWFRKRDDMGRFAEKVTDVAYQLHNWYHFNWICGDHIVEQHVHNLDVCNWAKNAHPVKAFGMGSRIGGHSGRPEGDPDVVGNIFDNFSIEYVYEDGSRMLSQCRHIPGCWNSVSEALHGTKGFCQVNDYKIDGKRVGREAKVSPYVQEHTDLIASIRGGQKPENELKHVAESTMTAILGRMAAYSGKETTWEAALNSKEDLMDEAKLTWDAEISTPPVPSPGGTRRSAGRRGGRRERK